MITRDMNQKEKINMYRELIGLTKKQIAFDLKRSNTAVKRWFKKESKISHELVDTLSISII